MAQCTCLSHQASTSSEENRAIIPTDDSFSISSIQPEDSIEFVSQVTARMREVAEGYSSCLLIVAFIFYSKSLKIVCFNQSFDSTFDLMNTEKTLFSPNLHVNEY